MRTLNDTPLSDGNLRFISGQEDGDDKREPTETVSPWFPGLEVLSSSGTKILKYMLLVSRQVQRLDRSRWEQCHWVL